jgi:hypothetical protein
LAVSHTFWWHASLAETYTLWAALFLGELVVLLQYTRTQKVGYLYGLVLLNGLALAVHMFAAIPLACYAVLLIVLWVRRSIQAKHLAAIAALWVLGALPYEYLILRNIVQSRDVLGTLASAAFGSRWQADVLDTTLSWRLVKEDVLFIVLNFPTPNALLLFVGLYGLHRMGPPPAFRRIIAALLVLFFVFAALRSRIASVLPALLLRRRDGDRLGIQEVLRRGWPCPTVLVAAFALLPAAVYAVAPGLAQRWNLSIGTRQDIPYRNDYEYFLRPWRTGHTGAERFARAALKTAEPNAIICADSTTIAPLLYVQEVQGVRPDVKIAGIVSSQGSPRVNEPTVDELMKERPVYVVSKRPGTARPSFPGKYSLAEAGVLWRVAQPAPADVR